MCPSPPAEAPVGAHPGSGSPAVVSPRMQLSSEGPPTSAPCPAPSQQPDDRQRTSPTIRKGPRFPNPWKQKPWLYLKTMFFSPNDWMSFETTGTLRNGIHLDFLTSPTKTNARTLPSTLLFFQTHDNDVHKRQYIFAAVNSWKSSWYLMPVP